MWERTGLGNTKSESLSEEKINRWLAWAWTAQGPPSMENDDTENQVSERKTRNMDEQLENNRILEQSTHPKEEEQPTA
jgi:hypothetical protein